MSSRATRARQSVVYSAQPSFPAAAATSAADRPDTSDIRADNLLLTPDGTVRIVDWPWACVGPAWLDAALLLVNVRLFGGQDATALLHACAATYDADVVQGTSPLGAPLLARYDLDRPANQAKLEAADALAELADDAGMSLVHLAVAFTLAHPAVTAPIIGPRTMEQLESQLGAADVVLGTDVLDRIDEIVPPGTTLSDVDAGYKPPALTDPFLRRRRTA